MRITLYGIRGLYNFGCEAIVRGAYKLFSELYPEAEISYYSYNFEYDNKMLRDIPIKIKKVETKVSIASRCINKLLRIMKIDKQILMFNYKEIIRNSDIIVSIGGDIYTVPRHLHNKKTYPYYNELVDFCNRAIMKGKKIILYGASVGPFGEYQRAIDYYKRNLSKYKMIMCRENESIDYLRSLGLNNVCFFPDPAFNVIGDKGEKKARYIGINLSPLSLKEIYGGFDESNLRNMANILDEIFINTGKELMFIPHVLSCQRNDNDLTFMEELMNYMVYKDKVRFANVENGFIGVKSEIRKCCLVISARMHCDINAICENVPSIFLSYSKKSIGMCQYIYGDMNWVVNMNDIHRLLIPKIKEMLEKTEDISKYLEEKNSEIVNFYEIYKHNLKHLIDC